ncbi:hypothetical protein EW146_g2801 [Bondarzewia mesenterica]|uniref:Uncharacterized protein n=1 Tax=Bondarzewia mesenterica TaxID=1095465 RepID=A0A4S4M133_9AGAM|nr:hypothetical protein EW146_g2801 [Bondarzewia mesenterica]
MQNLSEHCQKKVKTHHYDEDKENIKSPNIEPSLVACRGFTDVDMTSKSRKAAAYHHPLRLGLASCQLGDHEGMLSISHQCSAHPFDNPTAAREKMHLTPSPVGAPSSSMGPVNREISGIIMGTSMHTGTWKAVNYGEDKAINMADKNDEAGENDATDENAAGENDKVGKNDVMDETDEVGKNGIDKNDADRSNADKDDMVNENDMVDDELNDNALWTIDALYVSDDEEDMDVHRLSAHNDIIEDEEH